MSTFEEIAAAAEEDFSRLPTLESFPGVVRDDYVTVCEINGELKVTFSGDPDNAADSSGFTNLTDYYVPIYGDTLKPIQTQKQKIPSIKTTVTISEPFLVDPNQEHGIKGVWNAWKDAGYSGILQALQGSGTPEAVVASLQKIANLASLVTNAKKHILYRLYPHLKLTPEQMIEYFGTVRSWSKSWIRAMSWHPQFPKLAIALRDDSIRVFVNEFGSYVTPFLKAPEQVLVAALAWRPYCEELAVGVEKGIVLWNVLDSVKPGHVKSEFITSEGHGPVTAVEYSYTGHFLLSASPADARVIVWEVNTGEYVALRRYSGGGIPRAMWSPNSTSRIFSTTAVDKLRVWSLDEDSCYKPTTWSTASPDKPVEAIAWHPNGSFIIFSSDSVLYALNFKPHSVEFIDYNSNPRMIPLFNVKECFVGQDQSNSSYKIGGKVVQMEWDPTGRRLVVLFDDSNLLVLFHLLPSADIRLLPFGFIKGHPGEFPVTMSFQKDVASGALLTVAWSSGRAQYFPFIFSENGVGVGNIYASQSQGYSFNGDKLSESYKSPKSASVKNSTTYNASAAALNSGFKLFSHDDEEYN